MFTVEALNKVILPYNIQFYSITKLTVFQEFKTDLFAFAVYFKYNILKLIFRGVKND